MATTYFQAVNESNTFQIDGLFKSFVLRRKTVVTSTIGSSGDNTTAGICSYIETPINNDEIVALAGPLEAAVLGVTNGKLNLIVHGDVGSQVTCYFFGPITTSSAGSGLQIYDEAKSLVFCASLNNLKFSGFINGANSLTIDTNRTYAAIMLTQKWSSFFSAFGIGSIVVWNWTSFRGMTKSIPGGIQVVQVNEFVQSRDQSASQPIPQRPVTESVADNFHAVIDVTGF